MPKTKWWKLKEEATRGAFVEAVKAKFGTSLPQDWKETSSGIRSVAQEVLGVSTGRRKLLLYCVGIIMKMVKKSMEN